MMPAELYRSVRDLPQVIAIFPLEGALLLPRAELPLNIFEPRYLDMVQDAMSGHRIIAMVQPRPDAESKAVPPVYDIGCAGRVTTYAETADGRLLITLTGICRVRIADELPVATAYRQVETDFLPFAGDLDAGAGEAAVDRASLLEAFRAYLDARHMSADWDEVEAAGTETLVNTLAMLTSGSVQEKQALLEAPGLVARAEAVVALTRMAAAGIGTGRMQ